MDFSKQYLKSGNEKYRRLREDMDSESTVPPNLGNSDFLDITNTKWQSLSFKKEPFRFNSSDLKRQKGKYKRLSSEKTGIVFHQRSLNTMKVLFESYHCLVLHRQLCQHAFTNREIRYAKHYRFRIEKLFHSWKDVFQESDVTRSFLTSNSVILRLKTLEYAQRIGRPLLWNLPQ